MKRNLRRRARRLPAPSVSFPMPNAAPSPGSTGLREPPVGAVPWEECEGCPGMGRTQLGGLTAPAVPCSRAGPQSSHLGEMSWAARVSRAGRSCRAARLLGRSRRVVAQGWLCTGSWLPSVPITPFAFADMLLALTHLRPRSGHSTPLDLQAPVVS